MSKRTYKLCVLMFVVLGWRGSIGPTLATQSDDSVGTPFKSQPTGTAPRSSTDSPDAHRRLVQLAQRLAKTTPGVSAPPPDVQVHQASPVEPIDVRTSVSSIDVAPAAVVLNEVERRALGPSRSRADATAKALPGLEDSQSSSWILKTITALGIVLGLVLLVRAVLMRVSGGVKATTNSAVIDVLSRVSVAPRSHILLIRAGQRVLMVGESSTGLRTLADITDPDEVSGILSVVAAAQPASVTKSFTYLLRRFNTQYSDEQRLEDEGSDESEHLTDRVRDRVSNLRARMQHLAGRGGA